jgi:hypothetical protein
MSRNEFQIKPHWINQPGWLHVVLPESVKEELIQSMETPGEDARSTLRGHLAKEYHLPITPEVSAFTRYLAYQYINEFGMQADMGVSERRTELDFELQQLWVNYQNKHDFNPTHIHSGAFSFVIWVKIPFDYKEEQKVYPSVNGCETAAFYFSYISPLGGQDVHYINLDSDWEWSMVFFPARMYHGVNPFYTSDEQRISISGNVYAK